MFIGTRTGIVSATHPAAALAARSPTPTAGAAPARARAASTVSTFQLSGRLARRPTCATSSSISSSVNRSRQPSMMPSSVVPSCSPTASHSASSSSRSAQREATGWPSPSEWVRRQRGREAERRRPRCDSCSSSAIVRRSASSVGLVADGVGAHHVAAQRAVADQEAGVDAEVRRRARRGTRRRSPSSTTPFSSAASGMPSTLAIMRRR